MNSRIIIAPEYRDTSDAPVIFLAGPIQGARRWQDDAIAIIRKLNSGLYIASPRRPTMSSKGDFTEAMYNEQVDWETEYLNRAAYEISGKNKGVILFWLAKEAEHACSRAYAQTTRFELAEWKVKHEHNGVNLVVGIEPGFTGERYIRRRFYQDCARVPVCITLEETCQQTVTLLAQQP